MITNSLSDPEDLRSLVDGMQIAREIATQEFMREIIVSELKPGVDRRDRTDLEADLRRRLMLIYHPVGTCRMSDGREDAVVDSQLRVRGGVAVRLKSARKDAMPANDQLTALDATFLELEQADDSALMHIGGALVFDPLPGGGTPPVAKVREHLEQRLDLLPRYRQKLDAPRTGGLSWPSWESDEHFEIEAHVRHATLPSPGDEREFLDWVSDFYSHRLDRSRPLWEMVLLDGLADGRWALVWKTHHCLVDGVGSVDAVDLLLDAEPAPGEPLGGPPRAGGGLRRRPRTDGSHICPRPCGRRSARASRPLARGAHTLMHPREGFATLARGDRSARPRRADRGAGLEPKRADRRDAKRSRPFTSSSRSCRRSVRHLVARSTMSCCVRPPAGCASCCSLAARIRRTRAFAQWCP